MADAIASYEKELIGAALNQTGGVQTRAAAVLGTTRRILNYRMKKLNLQAADYAASGCKTGTECVLRHAAPQAAAAG